MPESTPQSAGSESVAFPNEAEPAASDHPCVPQRATVANDHEGRSPLKIIVAATPKTGNTWVKFLLGEAYGLAFVDLPDHRQINWPALGTRWIGHQHYLPDADLLDRGREQGVIFVVVIRHPADVLVSLRHHLQNSGAAPSNSSFQPESMLLDEPGRYGLHTRSYLDDGFHLTLHTSIAWLHLEQVRRVRYEDLWERPFETLKLLTDEIAPLPDDRVRRAVEACELKSLRDRLGARWFFRKGGAGGWYKELPASIQHYLSKTEPYPIQFAALGYQMQPAAGGDDAGAMRAWLGSQAGARSADGTPVAPLLKEIYSSLPQRLRRRWPDIEATTADCFFCWLISSAAADPDRGMAVPLIPELAYQIYLRRDDVRAKYPKPFGRHRFDFAHWFIYFAVAEYGLDRRVALPVLHSFARACRFTRPTPASVAG